MVKDASDIFVYGVQQLLLGLLDDTGGPRVTSVIFLTFFPFSPTPGLPPSRLLGIGSRLLGIEVQHAISKTKMLTKLFKKNKK